MFRKGRTISGPDWTAAMRDLRMDRTKPTAPPNETQEERIERKVAAALATIPKHKGGTKA